MIKNLKFKIKNCQGFTLIEILIAVSIFVLVMGMVVAIFITNSKIQNKTQAVRETSQTLRYAMEAIGREVQLADGCVLKNINGEGTLRTWPIINVSDDATSILTLARTDKNNSNNCIVHEYKLVTETDSTTGVVKNKLVTTVTVNNAKGEPIDLNDASSVSISEFKVSPDYNKEFYSELDANDLPNLDHQPSIRVELKAKFVVGAKAAESSTQTLQTAFTTRNYPGFNDITQ